MGLHLMSMRLIGMHLIGVDLIGVYLIGVYLIGMHLMGMHLLQGTRTRNRSPDPFRILLTMVDSGRYLRPRINLRQSLQ
jgi:hypothetical protein